MKAILFLSIVIWLAANGLCKSSQKIPSKTNAQTSTSNPTKTTLKTTTTAVPSAQTASSPQKRTSSTTTTLPAETTSTRATTKKKKKSTTASTTTSATTKAGTTKKTNKTTRTTTLPPTTTTTTSTTTTPTTTITTPSPPKPSEVTLALTEFTVTLYKELSKKLDDPERNLFISPFSVAVVLSMLNVGARENTAYQLLEILNFYDYAADLSEDEINQEIGTLLRSVKGTGNVTLETANQIYVADGLSLLESFQSASMAYFGTEAQVVDFADDKTRVIINNWVEEVTHHMIKELLPEGSINDNTALVLVNALYFKANWKLPFDPELTSDRTFYLGSEDKSVDVPTMNLFDEKFRVGFFEDLNARVLEIPYEGDLMSMFVILPNDVGGLPAVEEKLNSTFLDQIDDQLYSMKIYPLSLPKFEIETNVGKMKEILVNLGLTDLFTEQCDLSGMLEDAPGLHVSDIVHKAIIKVNEQGTEAAAATAAITSFSMGVPFEVNRPALFFIRDNRSKLILFIGRLADPSRTD